MTSLNFPDVNVWLALLLEDHIHRTVAISWWESASLEPSDLLALLSSVFSGYSRPGGDEREPFLHGRPWAAYDRLFDDDRVAFIGESQAVEIHFRRHAALQHASPKLWADAWLLAMAEKSNATLLTFDRALAARSHFCKLLA
jgi:predicted nucleic acid-binding protein